MNFETYITVQLLKERVAKLEKALELLLAENAKAKLPKQGST